MVEIVLKNAIVVKNLGPNVLIGEPGKMDNEIVTFPSQKLIQLRTNSGRLIKLPYHSRSGKPLKSHQAFSLKQSEILYPNDVLKIPIPAYMQCNAYVLR